MINLDISARQGRTECAWVHRDPGCLVRPCRSSAPRSRPRGPPDLTKLETAGQLGPRASDNEAEHRGTRQSHCDFEDAHGNLLSSPVGILPPPLLRRKGGRKPVGRRLR